MTQPSLPTASASHTEDHEQHLAGLVSELTDRAQRGEAVDLETECRNHPQFADDLRELWGVIVVASAAGSHPPSAAAIPTTTPLRSAGRTAAAGRLMRRAG